MLRTTSRSRSSRTVACTADSRASWVMKTRSRLGPVALLLGGADADVVPGEHTGDRVQHARAVDHVEAQQIFGRGLVDGPDVSATERTDRAVCAMRQVHRGIDHITEHGARGRRATGTAPIEHQRADRRALDEHGVVTALDAGQGVCHRHHRRVHAHGDVAGRRIDLGDPQQLDDVAEAFGHGDVGGRDPADALVVHVAGDDPRPERDRCHDRCLGAGVEALHIGSGVAFGEAECLGLGQRCAVLRSFLGHLGEDEVGRAVDDPHHTGDGLAAQALAQRTDDGDAAGHGRLEEQIDTGFVADAEQFCSDVGQQLLVGGDDRLTGPQCRRDQFARRFDATDHLDDEVDRRVRHDCVRVASEHPVGQLDIALAAEVAHRHGSDLQAHTGAGLDGRLLRRHQFDEGGTDVAAPQYTDPHERCHGRKATG